MSGIEHATAEGKAAHNDLAAIVSRLIEIETREERGQTTTFHGAITEELGDWAWTTTPTVEAVKIVDDLGSHRRAIEIRDVLERLGVPVGVHGTDSPVGQAITKAAGGGAPAPL